MFASIIQADAAGNLVFFGQMNASTNDYKALVGIINSDGSMSGTTLVDLFSHTIRSTYANLSVSPSITGDYASVADFVEHLADAANTKKTTLTLEEVQYLPLSH